MKELLLNMLWKIAKKIFNAIVRFLAKKSWGKLKPILIKHIPLLMFCGYLINYKLDDLGIAKLDPQTKQNMDNLFNVVLIGLAVVALFAKVKEAIESSSQDNTKL